MSAHTPGPWSLSSPSHTFYVKGPNGEYILRRDARDTYDRAAASRIGADCRLIAAAPCLLAALQAAISAFDDMDVLNGWDANARAAIAKATGAAQ